ncbi:MAG: MFS transporter, partial [Endomicrobia bacterium]|nr:MFS transporter [Endomicrobiia bacterium]
MYKFFNIFSPFKFRNYTYLWSGAFISNIGSWVQTLALNWYIVNKLNLAVYLGILNFVSSLPIIFFSLPAGVLADKVSKKTIIIITHIIMSVITIVLGLVIHYMQTNTIIWIFIIILIIGLCNSFTNPAWQSILPQLVD